MEKVYILSRPNGLLEMTDTCHDPKPTITEEDGTTRKKTYAELSASEKLQADCDYKATNITEDLDAYDSDCDDVFNAKVVLMANLSNYGSDIILEVSVVNTSLKKLKYHLGQSGNVKKKRITPDAITEGEWGFEHTKTIFLNEIIPFLKTLKDIFNVLDKDLLNEATKVQTVFNQMEATVQ
nr:hypothetical protein [Tanacetum cinerariifolium]